MVTNFKMLYRYRELLWMWAWRDIKARYKQTLFGFTWAIVQPLLMTVIFTVIFTRFVPVDTGGIPYPIFAYTALLPWVFFTRALTASINNVLANMDLLRKVYFPREILPFASVAGAGLDFLCGLTVFLGLMLVYQVPVSPYWVIYPFLLLTQTMLALGVGLFAGALNVAYRDVGQMVPLILQVWQYATPIIYPVSLVPERWRGLYMLNPMAGIVDSYRRIVLLGQPPEWGYLALASGISSALFILGYLFFKRVEHAFVDVM